MCSASGNLSYFNDASEDASENKRNLKKQYYSAAFLDVIEPFVKFWHAVLLLKN
jgi:hypothetical protein